MPCCVVGNGPKCLVIGDVGRELGGGGSVGAGGDWVSLSVSGGGRR